MVTIIVLLILAGISISVISGNNGIINNAIEAKEKSEIADEKEKVETSAIQAMGKNKYGNVTREDLKEKLNKNAGEGKTEVFENGKTLVVRFVSSNRYYEVDNDGNVETFTIYEDNTPGELAGTGKEDDPFRIECIEDLVVFSMMTNGGNTELGIKSNNFNNSYVTLERTLDFETNFSYNDYTTKKYGDLNKDGMVEDIKTELTKKSDGCIGFTGINDFRGYFDGKENEIRNIYQKVNTGSTGMFKSASKEIKNLTVTGNVTNTAWHAAGICAEGIASIINCKNYANVTGYNMAGGIQALKGGGVNIAKCINRGACEGGIIGWLRNDGLTDIINCINLGKCSNSGIIGSYGFINESIELNINNCYNAGYGLNTVIERKNISASSTTEITKIENTFYNTSKSTNIGAITEGITGLTEEQMKNGTLLNMLNDNIGTNTDWNEWTEGEEGYPTFK